MQPTGTECVWSISGLNLSENICKFTSDAINQVRGDRLLAKSMRGVMALGVGTVFERGLRLVRNMILARLLAPSEFGLMAIILAVSTALESFSDVGVGWSIIYNKNGDKPEYLNVAWWFQAIRGIGLFLIAFSATPWLASFYGNPDLLIFLRVAFVTMLFGGFVSPGIYLLDKKIHFGKRVFIIQGSGLLGTIVSLGIAFYGIRNVWTLVLGFLAEAAFKCLLSYVLCPFLPSLKINKECLKDILSYARGMFGLPLLTILALQMDVIILGKVVTPEQLGMYSLALALAYQPNLLLSKIIGPILLPVFSKKQDEKEILCKALLKVIRASLFIGAPVTLLFVVFARPLLTVFYGAKYALAAKPFSILCLAMLMSMQGGLLSSIYFAIGKPHLQRKYLILLIFFILSLMYPAAVFFGLLGASCVLLFSHTLAMCVQAIWMSKQTGLNFKDYVACWIPSFRWY